MEVRGGMSRFEKGATNQKIGDNSGLKVTISGLEVT